MNRLLNQENNERLVLRPLNGDVAVGDALKKVFDRNRLHQFQPQRLHGRRTNFENPVEAHIRRQENALSQRQRGANENPEEAQLRRQNNAHIQHVRRANENPKEGQVRLLYVNV